MGNRYLKYFSLLGVFLIIASCSTLRINFANKNLVIPGVPKANKFTSYKIEIESKQNFSIDKIMLGNNPVNEFSIYNSSTKLYENIDKNNFKRGKYLLSFKSFNIKSQVDDSLVIVSVIQRDKRKTISSTIKTLKTIHKR